MDGYFDKFLGESIPYWIELRRRVDCAGLNSLRTSALLAEIHELRGRLSFYESRIKEMNATAIQELRTW
jgi:hypothetical protein